MSKPSRGVPFTPLKRPQSQSPPGADDSAVASISTQPSASRFPSTIRAQTPLGHAGPPKKIRAAISAESRPRSVIGNLSRPASVIGTAPGTPKKTAVQSRHGTPRRGNESAYDLNATADFENPEEGLVDFQNVEVDPDASFDVEDVFGGEKPRLSSGMGSKEDKVLVSIR
jgi:centromeric protein E